MIEDYKRFSVRGQIDSRLSEGDILQSGQASVSWRFKRDWYNSLQIRKTFDASDVLTLTNKLTWKNKFGHWTFSSNVNKDSSYGLGLTFSTFMGFHNTLKRPYLKNRNLSSSGRINLNLFIDEDNNGVYGEDEESFVDINYTQHNLTPTDDDRILLSGLPADRLLTSLAGFPTWRTCPGGFLTSLWQRILIP